MINVLCATKDPDKGPRGLEHMPGERLKDWRITWSGTPGWAQASNELLDIAAREGEDALFLDDDVTLTEETFSHLADLRPHADMFGFDLHDLSGARQVGARHTWTADGALVDWVEAGPAYVAHVSTSACYISHAVLAAGVRFPEWAGLYFEDVAFCFETWQRGFRVLAIPGRVDHDIESGAGATKRNDPLFWQRWGINRHAFYAWCAARDLREVPREARALT